MILNDNTVDIEKSDGISSPTFIVDKCSGLFLCAAIFSVKNSRSAFLLAGFVFVFCFLFSQESLYVIQHNSDLFHDIHDIINVYNQN